MTRNRGIIRQANACPANWSVSWQWVLRNKEEHTCYKQGEVRREGERMKAIPRHPGLASEFQGRPEASIPDAGTQRGWRVEEAATAYHGDTRPRGALRLHTGQDGVQGSGGRASGLERCCRHPWQGP